MAIRTLVVDDEPLARALIEGYVRQTPFLELAATCSNAVDALARIRQGDIELAFMDIQMPELSGMELSRLVEGNVKVVFVTAFDQYAVEGFKVDAVDYLLKPVSYPEFLRAADRARSRIEPEVAASVASVEPKPTTERLFVKTDGRTIAVELNDILYIEGVKDYVKIHTVSSGSVVTLSTMKAVEQLLPAERFCRVHRSFIVNVERVNVIERGRIVFGKEYIPISEGCREAFNEALSRRSIIVN